MAEEPRAARTSDYDEFVDWEARLAREAPFFRELFDRAGVRRVIDVGSGSARHAIMFATWGLDVVAVDPDESMLEEARRNLTAARAEVDARGGAVTLVRGGFGQLIGLGVGPADALTCTGNALPHVADSAGLSAAIDDFAAVLRPGGVVVIHLLNHAGLLKRRPRVIPPKVRETATGTKVFLRLIDYPADGEYLDFDFVTLTRDAEGSWHVSDRRSLHTVVTAERLEGELRQAGFHSVEVFGDHARKPLAEGDESVIVTAVRG